jgi:hypothetical protein
LVDAELVGVLESETERAAYPGFENGRENLDVRPITPSGWGCTGT